MATNEQPKSTNHTGGEAVHGEKEETPEQAKETSNYGINDGLPRAIAWAVRHVENQPRRERSCIAQPAQGVRDGEMEDHVAGQQKEH